MKHYFIFLFVFLLVSCGGENTYRDVGDIPFDPSLDDATFQICDEENIKQYYVRYSSDEAPGFIGEKKAMDRMILNAYSYPNVDTQDGYITIRFIVNCKGQTDRFRIEEMSVDYQPFDFDPKLSDQLLNIVKQLEGWVPRKTKGKPLDYYQYLTFKIRDGQILKILP